MKLDKGVAFLSRMLQPKMRWHIGLDIGTTALKIAEIEHGKKPRLSNYAVAMLPEVVARGEQELDAQVLTATLEGMLSTLRLKGKAVTASLGGQAALVREVKYPKMGKEELAQMLQWEIPKHVPYEPDSFYYDFAVLPEGEAEEEQRILLAAVPKETVQMLHEAVSACGLELDAIDIEQLALARTLPNPDQLMLLDLGGKLAQMIIYQQGKPEMMRYLGVGGQQFTEVLSELLELDFAAAEKFKLCQSNLFAGDATELDEQMELLLEELARELRRTYDYYLTQSRGAKVKELLLVGGGALLNNIAVQLGVVLERDVRVHDPLERLLLPDSFDQNSLKEVAPQLGVACGLALRGW